MDSVNLNDLIKEFELEVIRGFDKIDSTELLFRMSRGPDFN